MQKNLYPVGFGQHTSAGNIIDKIVFFSGYEEAKKKVHFETIQNEYTAIQFGIDGVANMVELMIFNEVISSWVMSKPCWTKKDFDILGEFRTLKVPIYENQIEIQHDFFNSIVELFRTKFGVKFYNLLEPQEHYSKDTWVKPNKFYLDFSCIVPEGSMRALKESYGCILL